MNNTIKRTWNQGRMVNIEDLLGMTFQAESGGHTFEISGVDADGNALALSGTPAGVMLRPDNTDQVLTCSVSDGKVYATLPAECYDVPGRAAITIFLTSDSQKTALYAAVVSISRTQSGTAAPGTTADVVDLISRINTAINNIPVNYNAAFAVAYENLTFPVAQGTYCIYNGVLEKAKVDIATSESFTQAHWDSTNLGAEMAAEAAARAAADSDLKSALTSYNAFNILAEYGTHTNSTSSFSRTWINNETLEVNGTPSSHTNIFVIDSENSMPSYFTAGSKYNIKFSTTNAGAYLRCMTYVSGSLAKTFDFTGNGVLTIPSDTTGIQFAIRFTKNITYTNDRVFACVENTLTNAELDSRIDSVLQNIIAKLNIDVVKDDIEQTPTLTEGYAIANATTVTLVMGEPIAVDSKFAITGYIQIPLGTDTIDGTMGVGGGDNYGWCLYDIMQNVVAGGQAYPISLSSYPTAKYIRATDYSATSNHSGKTLVFKTSVTLDALNDLVSARFPALGYIRTGDADSLYTKGYYYVNPQSSFQHLPVLKYGVLANFYDESGRSVQVYFCVGDSAGSIYIRNRSSVGSYSDWYPMQNPYAGSISIALIGDSFTVGRFSYYDGEGNPVTSSTVPEQAAKEPTEGWQYKLFTKIRKYGTVTNLAKGGMGWVHPTTTGSFTPYGIISDNSFDTYNYVLIWLGINDYNNAEPLGTPGEATSGDGTVCGEIIRCIELLATKTDAHICLVTPVNTRFHGTVQTHYALDYDNTSGYSLRDLAHAIEYYADFYGIDCVNLSEHCSINQLNMVTYLPDEVHPTMEGHTMLARELDRRLQFN